MKKVVSLLTISTLMSLALPAAERTLSLKALQDKIKGGWAGKTIGCTFGAPVEFVYQGTFVPDCQPLL